MLACLLGSFIRFFEVAASELVPGEVVQQWQGQVALNKGQAVPHEHRRFHVPWDLELRQGSRVVTTDLAFRSLRQLRPVFEEVGVRAARLLYSSSVHECTDQALWQKIENCASSLVLLRTTEGSVCGGYAGGSGARGVHWPILGAPPWRLCGRAA